MLNHKYRFHSRGGVNFVRSKGDAMRTPYFTVNYAPNDRGYRRFAVVVSKKIAKSAVLRNRIRRRIYEAIRLEFPANQPKTDYVFIVHTAKLADLPFEELREHIKHIITNIHKP